MNPRAFLVGGISVAALCGVCFAFLSNASPYVTIEQAKASKQDNLHVGGDLVRSSVDIQTLQRRCVFVMKDPSGDSLTVVSSDIPSNMGEATKVVAVGKMNGDHFAAHKLLLKCPSKYESEQKYERVAKN